MAAKLGMSLRTQEGVFGSFPIFEHPINTEVGAGVWANG